MTKPNNHQRGAAANKAPPGQAALLGGGVAATTEEEQARAILSAARRAMEEEDGGAGAGAGKLSLKRSLEWFLEGRRKDNIAARTRHFYHKYVYEKMGGMSEAEGDPTPPAATPARATHLRPLLLLPASSPRNPRELSPQPPHSPIPRTVSTPPSPSTQICTPFSELCSPGLATDSVGEEDEEAASLLPILRISAVSIDDGSRSGDSRSSSVDRASGEAALKTSGTIHDAPAEAPVMGQSPSLLTPFLVSIPLSEILEEGEWKPSLELANRPSSLQLMLDSCQEASSTFFRSNFEAQLVSFRPAEALLQQSVSIEEITPPDLSIQEAKIRSSLSLKSPAITDPGPSQNSIFVNQTQVKNKSQCSSSLIAHNSKKSLVTAGVLGSAPVVQSASSIEPHQLLSEVWRPTTQDSNSSADNWIRVIPKAAKRANHHHAVAGSSAAPNPKGSPSRVHQTSQTWGPDRAVSSGKNSLSQTTSAHTSFKLMLPRALGSHKPLLNSGVFKGRCFRCLALDHQRKDCRDPKRCLSCGNNGHFARACPAVYKSHRPLEKPNIHSRLTFPPLTSGNFASHSATPPTSFAAVVKTLPLRWRTPLRISLVSRALALR